MKGRTFLKDSSNRPIIAVLPASLYRQQLADRLGPGALKALDP